MSSSDIEGEPTPPGTTTLPLAIIRICIGIALGCSIVALLFCLWTLINDGGGPIIGVLVFELFTVSSLVIIVYYGLVKKAEFIHH